MEKRQDFPTIEIIGLIDTQQKRLGGLEMPQLIQHATRHCHRCNCQTLHSRAKKETNHILHLLLAVISLGLWLPIWILVAVSNGLENPSFLCTICGQRAGKLTPEQRSELFNRRLELTMNFAMQTGRAIISLVQFFVGCINSATKSLLGLFGRC